MSEEVVSMELPAPPGWKKQYFPKRGGTPRKKEIVFTAPSGEEIHNQRQLQQYLKAHPGGPPASEFEWGTGETPRRSSRISEKAKAVSPAEGEAPKKRGRKSSASEKDSKEKEASDEETPTGEVEMKDADEAKTEHVDQMEEAEKTEQEKTGGGDENNAQIQEESDETKEGKDKDGQGEEEKQGASTETKDSVSLEDSKAEDKKEAEVDKDGEVKADTKDVSQEQVKADAEEDEKEPTKFDGGVVTTAHETEPVQLENPQHVEQPLSDAVEKEQPLNSDAIVHVEANVHVDVGAKDNGQEPKDEVNTKPVEVTENGTQA